MKHLFDACRIRTKVVDREFDFNFTAAVSSSNTGYTDHYSRIVPHSLENYNIVCGSRGDNIKEQEVSRETWHKLPSEALCDDSSPHKGKVLSTVKEKWSLQEYPPHCQNVVVYKNESPHKYKTDMYYIKSLYTDIHISEEDSLNLIFWGTHVSIADSSKKGSDKVENRYYFMSPLESCDVQKSGNNFFYIEDDRLSCNLGINGQKNIVVVKGDFIDSKNIHSVIGSNEANHIEVSHAGYVDGKGGNDVITAKNFTTIKGYFGDSIHGKGLVLLPINFNDIDNITHVNNITTIYNKSGAFISVDKQTSVKTADGLFVTPTKIDDKTGVVTNLHVTKSLRGDIVLDDELDNLRKIENSNFNITKQLSSANYHSTIGSSSNHIFYPDKEHHNFYWEAPSNISHLYLFDNRNANITIAQANGILDFSQLNCTLDDMPFTENNEGEIKINKNGLNVTLLPNYKDVTVTFDGQEYYKFQDGELERDYCSHSLKVDGRFSVNGTDLLNHHNCFTFDSDKVLFLKLNNDLLLLSDRGALSISDYYSSVHKSWDLSIELSNKIMEPGEFGERANGFSSFRYYKPDEQGLQIYHNQPINNNDIGLVDLKGKSILDFDMKVMNDTLLLSHKNNTLVKVENWNTYQPAREMMFGFSDATVSNSKCIVSTCKSEDIVVEFNREKEQTQLDKELSDAVQSNSFSKVKSLVSRGANINAKDNDGNTLLHNAARENRLDAVKCLIDNGANINVKNNRNLTPSTSCRF
ncbi:ankyrin repeat domain-containing protein [Wolbachia endosymbiont (group A) of Portevinia maculata]|uniref:ankyrin repeat domain-containing protein n=1 Tax=Wolbachia endosymbiont (group A) of Portevinia maculata TaxID=3066155 RepID=UPI00333FEBF0